MEKNNIIAEMVQRNFISKISYFSKYNNKIKVSENDEFLRVDSMLPSDTFNICVLKNRESLEKDSIFREMTEYFNKKSFPAAVWIWDDNLAAKEKMSGNGFGLSETETGMYIKTDKIVTETHKYNNIEIKKVSSCEEMEDFSNVIASIFGETKESHYVREQYGILAKKEIYTGSDMSFYAGYLNNDPVSCGTIYVTEESTGIYDVAVKEDHRKKGFGSSMFAYLMSEAKKTGTEYCILQASSDGAGIYRKMGFNDVCSIDIYENRDFLDKRN